MTAIAAWYDHETRSGAMGWDDVAWLGDTCVRSQPKAIRLGDALVGISGSTVYLRPLRAQGPLLRSTMAQELHGDRVQKWTESLIDSVHEWARTRGHGHVGSDGVWVIDVSLLVLTPAGIWEAGPSGDVARLVEPYAAMGSGHAVALGALAVLQDTCPNRKPRWYVKSALEAALRHSNAVGAFSTVETVPMDLGLTESAASG